MYQQITAEEAKKIMDSGEEYIILDTREQDEFDEGHIPNAILIPYTEIDNKAEELNNLIKSRCRCIGFFVSKNIFVCCTFITKQ